MSGRVILPRKTEEAFTLPTTLAILMGKDANLSPRKLYLLHQQTPANTGTGKWMHGNGQYALWYLCVCVCVDVKVRAAVDATNVS